MQLFRNDRMWRSHELKSGYDVVIVGAGVHGLATAYYLGKLHGVRKVALLDKSYLGAGAASNGAELKGQRGSGNFREAITPSPCRTVIHRPAGIFSRVSVEPSGQRISRSARSASPSPKCSRWSSTE